MQCVWQYIASRRHASDGSSDCLFGTASNRIKSSHHSNRLMKKGRNGSSVSSSSSSSRRSKVGTLALTTSQSDDTSSSSGSVSMGSSLSLLASPIVNKDTAYRTRNNGIANTNTNTNSNTSVNGNGKRLATTTTTSHQVHNEVRTPFGDASSRLNRVADLSSTHKTPLSSSSKRALFGATPNNEDRTIPTSSSSSGGGRGSVTAMSQRSSQRQQSITLAGHITSSSTSSTGASSSSTTSGPSSPMMSRSQSGRVKPVVPVPRFDATNAAAAVAVAVATAPATERSSIIATAGRNLSQQLTTPTSRSTAMSNSAGGVGSADVATINTNIAVASPSLSLSPSPWKQTRSEKEKNQHYAERDLSSNGHSNGNTIDKRDRKSSSSSSSSGGNGSNGSRRKRVASPDASQGRLDAWMAASQSSSSTNRSSTSISTFASSTTAASVGRPRNNSEIINDDDDDDKDDDDEDPLDTDSDYDDNDDIDPPRRRGARKSSSRVKRRSSDGSRAYLPSSSTSSRRRRSSNGIGKEPPPMERKRRSLARTRDINGDDNDVVDDTDNKTRNNTTSNNTKSITPSVSFIASSSDDTPSSSRINTRMSLSRMKLLQSQETPTLCVSSLLTPPTTMMSALSIHSTDTRKRKGPSTSSLVATIKLDDDDDGITHMDDEVDGDQPRRKRMDLDTPARAAQRSISPLVIPPSTTPIINVTSTSSSSSSSINSFSSSEISTTRAVDPATPSVASQLKIHTSPPLLSFPATSVAVGVPFGGYDDSSPLGSESQELSEPQWTPPVVPSTTAFLLTPATDTPAGTGFSSSNSNDASPLASITIPSNNTNIHSQPTSNTNDVAPRMIVFSPDGSARRPLSRNGSILPSVSSNSGIPFPTMASTQPLSPLEDISSQSYGGGSVVRSTSSSSLTVSAYAPTQALTPALTPQPHSPLGSPSPSPSTSSLIVPLPMMLPSSMIVPSTSSFSMLRAASSQQDDINGGPMISMGLGRTVSQAMVARSLSTAASPRAIGHASSSSSSNANVMNGMTGGVVGEGGTPASQSQSDFCTPVDQPVKQRTDMDMTEDLAFARAALPSTIATISTSTTSLSSSSSSSSGRRQAVPAPPPLPLPNGRATRSRSNSSISSADAHTPQSPTKAIAAPPPAPDRRTTRRAAAAAIAATTPSSTTSSSMMINGSDSITLHNIVNPFLRDSSVAKKKSRTKKTVPRGTTSRYVLDFEYIKVVLLCPHIQRSTF
jgi:hypothetical protein